MAIAENMTRTMHVVSQVAAPNSVISVPIILDAEGYENALGFTLHFSTTALANPVVTLGDDASTATLMVNDSQSASGNLVIMLALPTGATFTIGANDVVHISFSVIAPAGTITPVTFSDTLMAREVVSDNADPLPTTWVDGSVQVGHAPVAQDSTLTTAQDTMGEGTLLASDADNDLLTFSIVANGAHGVAAITDTATGAYSYTPATGYHGTDSFTFRAFDGAYYSNTATVTVTITAVNITAQPDLWIRVPAEAQYSGDNIYSTDGLNQKKALAVPANAAAMYLFHVQNDGSTADSFIITGAPRVTGWSIYYKRTDTNADISDAVTGAGWNTGSLAPGADIGVYVQVVPWFTLPAESGKVIMLAATSARDATKRDVVKTLTTVTVRHQPDLWIRKSPEPLFDGNNIYNLTGAGQERAATVIANRTVIFAFHVQNDGNTADSFTVTAPAGGNGWTVQYYTNAGANITAAITGSGWNSGMLSAGVSTGFYVKVTPTTAVSGAMLTLPITAASTKDGTKRDVVKTVTTVSSAYQPDLLIRTLAESTYTGDGIYNTDGVNQTRTQNVASGTSVIYVFRVQNDGNATDTMTVTGPAANSGWTVRYFNNASVDITDQVTGSGWSTGTLAPGSVAGLYVRVTPTTAVAGSMQTVLLTTTSSQDSAQRDAVKAVTTR